jgi:prolyl-tRNA synthetase
MTTIEDILAHLATLSISPSSTSHTAVNAGAAWKEELSKNNIDAHVTKTLVFKPKTAKSAVATPVVVIALEETTVPLGPLAKKINVKEMRMATPELLQEVFSVEKDNGESSR